MKKPKIEDNQKQIINYRFLQEQERILLEKEDIKKIENGCPKKVDKRPRFSLPAELEQERIPLEKEDIKKMENESLKKDDKRPPFSLPAELEQKSPPKIQNDDDLVPFFAKDYPSSDEEKEEICFINSPIPSETSSIGGEAEEVEGIEEEENQNSIEKNKNLNNRDLGQSNHILVN